MFEFPVTGGRKRGGRGRGCKLGGKWREREGERVDGRDGGWWEGNRT